MQTTPQPRSKTPRKTTSIVRAVTRSLRCGSGDYWPICNFSDHAIERAHLKNRTQTSDEREAITIGMRLSLHGSFTAAARFQIATEQWSAT